MARNEPSWPAIPLAPTLSPLLLESGVGLQQGLSRLSQARFRHVQWSATHPGLRPRDLDSSARRELLALVRRNEISISGIDAWIPEAHFHDAATMDRAMTAAQAAIEFAADLGRVPVSLILPQTHDLVESLTNHAAHHGVELVNHAVPPEPREGQSIGIDPASWLSAGLDPVEAVHRSSASLGSARLCDLSTAAMRSAVGESGGQLDVRAYRLALEVAGYKRPLVIDARQWADPWRGIEKSCECWLQSVPFPG